MKAVIDLSFLAHQAFHALGDLTDAEGVRQGVVYGVLSRLGHIAHALGTAELVFATDSPRSIRRVESATYKLPTTPPDTAQQEARKELFRQVDLLKQYLEVIGFPVVGWCGYEADDIIAVLAQHASGPWAIVSRDRDLYQCLSPETIIYDPCRKVRYTEADLLREWGVKPWQWGMAKVLAGCPGDGVQGIPGVGMKTAIRYLLHQLPKTGKKYQLIEAERAAAWEHNERLVILPHPTLRDSEECITVICGLAGTAATARKWREMVTDLEMPSLAGTAYPYSMEAALEGRFRSPPPARRNETHRAHGRVGR